MLKQEWMVHGSMHPIEIGIMYCKHGKPGEDVVGYTVVGYIAIRIRVCSSIVKHYERYGGKDRNRDHGVHDISTIVG